MKRTPREFCLWLEGYMDFHLVSKLPLTVEAMDQINAQLRDIDMFPYEDRDTQPFKPSRDTIQSPPPERSDEERFGAALDFLDEEAVKANDGGFEHYTHEDLL